MSYTVVCTVRPATLSLCSFQYKFQPATMSCPAAAAEPDVGASSATLMGPESAERDGDGDAADRIANAAASAAVFTLVDVFIAMVPPFVLFELV